MNPISPVVDAFVRTLWHEVNGLFPDKYVHIGGDEVNGACWGGNATIRAYMKSTLKRVGLRRAAGRLRGEGARRQRQDGSTR